MSVNFEALKNAKGLNVVFTDTSSIRGTDVRKLRQTLGFSQLTFSVLLNVSKKTIEKWEEGKNKIKGGDAVLVYLLLSDPNLVRRLIKICPKNNYQLSDQFAKFSQCNDLRGREISLEFTDHLFPDSEDSFQKTGSWKKILSGGKAEL